MDERDFDRMADGVIQRLMEALEDQVPDVEIDLEGGILTLVLPDVGSYLINKHRPNREIWLSSPKSGAWHFAHDADGGWISTRVVEGERPNLHLLLADELAGVTGLSVALAE